MTIRPLSSRVIFVALRNMPPGRQSPISPHFLPLGATMESGASYVNLNSEKFVAFTKTYVESTYVKNDSVAKSAAHSLLTISGLPDELCTAVRRKLRLCGAQASK